MSEQQAGGREGVRHVTVGPEQAGRRLDRFLTELLRTLPRSRIFRWVRKGEVRVNGRRASPEQRLQLGDDVRIPPMRIDATESAAPRSAPALLLERIERAIIHEDPRLLVIDKPAGIAVHGGSGLSFGVIEALRALRPDETLELVHRLDRDTSGCLLIARKRSALRTLHELLREGKFEKRYLALVRGQWDKGRTRIDVPLRTDTRVGGERTVRAHAMGKDAISDFRPVQMFGKRGTLMEVAIHTGRTHQIRVHAAHAGHPVAGDEKYGDGEFNARLRELGLRRMFLHAHSVGFDWPQGGEFSVNTPLPPELSAVIDRLSESKSPRKNGWRQPGRRASGRGRASSGSGNAKSRAPQGRRKPDQR